SADFFPPGSDRCAFRAPRARTHAEEVATARDEPSPSRGNPRLVLQRRLPRRSIERSRRWGRKLGGHLRISPKLSPSFALCPNSAYRTGAVCRLAPLPRVKLANRTIANSWVGPEFRDGRRRLPWPHKIL